MTRNRHARIQVSGHPTPPRQEVSRRAACVTWEPALQFWWGRSVLYSITRKSEGMMRLVTRTARWGQRAKVVGFVLGVVSCGGEGSSDVPAGAGGSIVGGAS